MSPRYVIARTYGSQWPHITVPLLDLPDAEHVHLHRQPDGTYTAAPMRAAVEYDSAYNVVARRWVDAPTGGDA